MIRAQRVAEARPSETTESARLARIEADYAEQLSYAGKRAEALTILKDAERRAQQLLATDPRNTRYRQLLQLIVSTTAETLATAGDRLGALAAYKRSAALIDALRESEPNDQGTKLGAMITHYALAVAQIRAGETTEGISRLRDAMGEAQAIGRSSPSNTFVVDQLAAMKVDLAEALIDTHTAEACRELQQAFALWDDLTRRARTPGESLRHRSQYEALYRSRCQADALRP
jgi:tetratricopeptide (TPR) repeat protein